MRVRRGCRRRRDHGGCTGVEYAVPDTCESAGRKVVGRFASRVLGLAGGCLGLMTVFCLMSGASAHAATTGRAATASSSPAAGSSGGLLRGGGSTVDGVVNAGSGGGLGGAGPGG